MFKDGEVLQGRYRIEHQLGEGGMGLVYLATDIQMAAKVVIKQSTIVSVESLRQEKAYSKLTMEELQDVVESSRQAFEREAKLLYDLKHAALPRTTAFFKDEQFFVMDYVPGKDLNQLLEDRLRQRLGPFPMDQVLGWADQILDALHYLHTEFDEPIIHRDIKPSNLKLTPKGQIVLLDFGLAKGARPGMTTAQSILAGTKEYAPIEQLDEDENARQKTDPRSDLYSLAMTLHHLLTGQLPATTISRVSAKAQNRPDPLRPIHELVPAVPATVSEVLQRAGAVFAKDRLATAAEMRNLLRQTMTLPPVIHPEAETELETFVQPKRRIVIPLNSEEKNSPLPVSGESYDPPPQSQPTGWLKNLSGQVASWLDQPSQSTSPPLRRTEPPKGGTTNKVTNGFTENLNGVKLEMVYVPGGRFMMGGDKYDDEKPRHEVTVPAFYIGKFQITQAQWKAVMGAEKNPSYFKGDNLPVENVSWNDAKKFCQKLSQLTGKTYRLPTEAEWEYACRAGTTGDYAGKLDEMAWYGNNSGKTQIDALKLWNEDFSTYDQKLTKNGNQPHPVGQKSPNAFGLYDMHGNVWEWCEDVWHDSYKGAPADGLAWLSGGVSGRRVLRGGSWSVYQDDCRSADRFWYVPGNHYSDIGFRVVVSSRTS